MADEEKSNKRSIVEKILLGLLSAGGGAAAGALVGGKKGAKEGLAGGGLGFLQGLAQGSLQKQQREQREQSLLDQEDRERQAENQKFIDQTATQSAQQGLFPTSSIPIQQAPAVVAGQQVPMPGPQTAPTLNIPGVSPTLRRLLAPVNTRARALAEQEGERKQFEAETRRTTAESLAFGRSPEGIGAKETAKQQARFPFVLSTAAIKNGINPLLEDGTFGDPDDIAEMISRKIEAEAIIKQGQFDTRIEFARDRLSQTLASATERATRREEIKLKLSPVRQESLDNLDHIKKKKAEIEVIRQMAPRIQSMFFGPGQQFAGLFGTLDLTKMAAQFSDHPDIAFARDFISRVETFTAELRHELYGAALTGTELPRVLASLPSPENALPTILDQIKIQEEALNRTEEAFKNRLQEVDDLLRDEPASEPETETDRDRKIREIQSRVGNP